MVGAISLGTVQLGLDYGVAVEEDTRPPSAQAAERFVREAVERGIDYIDTARAYGDSEAIVGRAIASYPDVVVATKLEPVAAGMAGRDLERVVERSIGDSRRTLGRDTLDILQVHSITEPPIPEALIDLMEAARERGWTRLLGASTYGAAAAQAVIDSGRFDIVQVAYSPLDREAEASALTSARLGVVARSVLLRGVLSRRFDRLPAALRPLSDTVRRLLDATAATPDELPGLAYRFVLGHPRVSTALVGTTRIEELDEIRRAAEAGPLPPEVDRAIREVTIDDADLLRPDRWPAGPDERLGPSAPARAEPEHPVRFDVPAARAVDRVDDE
jgi:spore coat polysaccharide biosynthesis protein SpsF